MKNSSNFTKKLLLLFMVLAIGFIGGLLGNLTSSKLSTNSSTTTKVNQVTTAYKNTNSTTQAVSKVKDAVVSVITYANNNSQNSVFGNDDSNNNNDNSQQVASEGSGVIYKKDGKYAYLVTNTHVISGAKKVDIRLADGNKVPGEIVGSDTYSDISVVRISADKVKSVAEFGEGGSSSQYSF